MKKGFTLIELLVVIAIIGLLSSIVLASLNSARYKGKVAAMTQFDSSIKHGIGDQLIGEWTFDDASNITIDTSGANNTGVIVGGATVASNGGYNNRNGLTLDGGTGYMKMPTLLASAFTNVSYTWSVWLKGNVNYSVTDNMPILGFGSGSWFRLGFFQGTNGLWYFDSYIDGTTNAHVSCGPKVDSTEWLHLTVSAQTGGKITCYRNGSPVASVNYIDNVTFNTPFAIGHSVNSAWAEYFQGVIDDVRVYSVALTSMDVRKLYAEGLGSHSLMLARFDNLPRQ